MCLYIDQRGGDSEYPKTLCISIMPIKSWWKTMFQYNPESFFIRPYTSSRKLGGYLSSPWASPVISLI